MSARAGRWLVISAVFYAAWAGVLLVAGNPQFGLSPGETTFTHVLTPFDYVGQVALAVSEIAAGIAAFLLARFVGTRAGAAGGYAAFLGHTSGAAQALWHVFAAIVISSDAARIGWINSVLFDFETLALVVGWSVLGFALTRNARLGWPWALAAALMWPLTLVAALSLAALTGSLAGGAIARTPLSAALGWRLWTRSGRHVAGSTEPVPATPMR